jgi:hypothetical protein
LLASTNADSWGVANPGGNLLTNGIMAGTGGAFAGSPAPTGVIAPFCTLDSQGSTGLTVAGAKIALGTIEQQQITLSGTPTTANPAVQLRQSVGSISSLAAGDVVEALAAVEIDAGQTGMRGMRFDLTLNDSGGVRSARTGEADSGAYPATAWKGVLRTPRLTVQANPTVMTLSLNLLLTQNVATNAVIRTSRWTLRKVA